MVMFISGTCDHCIQGIVKITGYNKNHMCVCGCDHCIQGIMIITRMCGCETKFKSSDPYTIIRKLHVITQI